MSVTNQTMRDRPLICHVIYRLDYGGLENGLVNIINNLPQGKYAHVIITLAGFSEYRDRLPPVVRVESVEKNPGLDLGVYYRLWRRFVTLKPDIVHTRNLSTLETQFAALLAGIRQRIHGEHGRDIHDLDNTRKRYQILRKLYKYIVRRYITVSRELESYLLEQIKIPARRVTRICNGVDTETYHPGNPQSRAVFANAPFDPSDKIIIGTVGRMQTVKDQLTLAKAFAALKRSTIANQEKVALVMIGDGPLRAEAQGFLQDRDLQDLAWLPGSRDDIAALLRGFDVFVLPSLAEGISNTLLEAMACGLPVVATDVGGNSELVAHGETGYLVPRGNPEQLADAIGRYVADHRLREAHGQAARERACAEFSLTSMVDKYARIYDKALEKSTPKPTTSRV